MPSLIINGRSVEARSGETLIDAALAGGIGIPHDCTSGRCGQCRVRLLSGAVDSARGDGRDVLACQARVTGHAVIAFDADRPGMSRRGVVTEVHRLAPDVVGVHIALPGPFPLRPGQHVSATFAGFPARDFSPTVRVDGTRRPGELVFHIRQRRGGIVSSQFGAAIRPGHKVTVSGPQGFAFLRKGHGPLVLVAGGIGWAPLWAIAHAACTEQPDRPLMVVVGAQDRESLYMRASLDWLVDAGVRDVVATAESGHGGAIRRGLATHYLPSLGLEDTVYAAGPAALVDVVRRKARAVSARCYAEPAMAAPQKPGMLDRFMQMLQGPATAAGKPARTDTVRPTARRSAGRP